ncbi:MAG: beta-lactamase family protein [Verrucomicrobiota bacterium]|nr:beta-lactamase family protein [Verrucomicrobiota bacterium]
MELDPETLRARLAPLFEENFARFGELGAAVSIWQHGKPILDWHGGFCDARREIPWSDDTLVLTWSATKGIGSACLLHALAANDIALEQRVADLWPAFAQSGKAKITLAQLLSHSAGLCALDQSAAITDYDAVVAALEKQAPLWPPGSAHGYHARTFGFLLDELTRRLTGNRISEYWRKTFADPLALDFWIGLPDELNARCATTYAARAGAEPVPAQFYRDLATPGTLQRRTFTSPHGLHAISAMNKPENRAQAIVSLSGVGTAHALAKFYAILTHGGELDGQRWPDTISRMTHTLAAGDDLVLEIPTAFSAGFMQNAPGAARATFGPSAKAFGHPGAGGCHAFADPENGIAFAYVMNQMLQSLLPNEKSLRLVDAIYQN